MIFWTGIKPIEPQREEKVLRDMCIVYIGVCNPLPPELERDHITRRCQHCGNIFQHPSSMRLEQFCQVCR